MKIIGITGKIGSGKSTAGKIIEEKGIPRIDCDKIVHALYDPGKPGAIKINAFFEGKYMLKDGSVNRKKLRKTLFKHPKKWEVLNRMIHPLVAEELRRELRKIEGEIAIIEIPIYTKRLFEEFIDELWVIDIKEAEQIKRLKDRDLTPEQIHILNNHLQTNKHEHTIMIDNNGGQQSLKEKIEDQLKHNL
jgi:dephospho-CoA kinase